VERGAGAEARMNHNGTKKTHSFVCVPAESEARSSQQGL
jgi:hypothetical protein